MVAVLSIPVLIDNIVHLNRSEFIIRSYPLVIRYRTVSGVRHVADIVVKIMYSLQAGLCNLQLVPADSLIASVHIDFCNIVQRISCIFDD